MTDDHMRAQLSTAKEYVAVLLRRTAGAADPGAREVTWEHGRRNFALRAEGVLAIVCAVPGEGDDSLAGIGIFDAPEDEVSRLMDADPGVEAGIFTYELYPCRGFPGDALPG